MKIRLANIPDEKEILKLWEEKIFAFLGKEYEERLNQYRDSVEEMIGHANVYLLEDKGEIKAFASVVGGYYISNFFVNTKEEGKLLMESLQERYDELQIDVHHKAELAAWIEDWGFTKLGEGQHDILSYREYQYEWLK